MIGLLGKGTLLMPAIRVVCRRIRSTQPTPIFLLWCKHMLDRSLDEESLTKLMAETEGILNCWPFTSSLPLSPSNILTTKSKIISPPPGDFWRHLIYAAAEDGGGFSTKWMNSGVAGGKNSFNYFKKGRNGQTLKGTSRLETSWSSEKQTPAGMFGRFVESCKCIVMTKNLCKV